MQTRAKRRRLEENNESSDKDTELDAKVKQVKTELDALRVVDLRWELGKLGLTKSGRKRELIDRLTPHRL